VCVLIDLIINPARKYKYKQKTYAVAKKRTLRSAEAPASGGPFLVIAIAINSS